ncbi:MAG: hypothetical protein NTZ39_00735 [Methanoregula sp.]|nr:hypothetical protein [Methanoregula sp.]
MDRLFFDELDLPPAQSNLDMGSGNHVKQTGRILAGIEQCYLKDRPDMFLKIREFVNASISL